MNKAQLIDFVAGRIGTTKKAAREAIEAVLDGIVEGLTADNRVALVGFGTFQLNEKKARTARNPKTGEPVEVPAKVFPKFRPSNTLKDIFEDFDLNEDEEVEEAEDAATETAE